MTYTNDERFQILHAEGSDDWTLQIKYVQKRDNGTYECQVGTNITYIYFQLIGLLEQSECWRMLLFFEKDKIFLRIFS